MNLSNVRLGYSPYSVRKGISESTTLAGASSTPNSEMATEMEELRGAHAEEAQRES